MDFTKKLDIAIRSRFTLIGIRTLEEERVLEIVRDLCQSTSRQALIWDHADYFQLLTETGPPLPPARDSFSALESIDKISGHLVFVLRDFHQCLVNQPKVIRKLKTIAHKLKYTRKSMIMTFPTHAVIPDEIKDEIVEMDFDLPNQEELGKILSNLLTAPNTQTQLADEQYDRLCQSALGLTSNQAMRLFSQSIVSDGVLDHRDFETIRIYKEKIISQSGALELYNPKETMADVGGLDMLKNWLKLRSRAFTKEARAYGLPAPKGIALIGIPGTGKSLTAKMIANVWEIPLLRLDIGALFGSYIGQSEENTRQALKLAETVSPCVLWIDEIEKALSTGTGDSGTSMRVFASILSWMQEKTKPVFIVATANNISLLPPELLRRGRFDEIFFLDLPTQVEREAIIKVHIKKRGRDPINYDIAKIAKKTPRYVGAELEQAIIESMYLAFNDLENPQREFTTDDIIFAAGKLVPMSKSQSENIELLRRWLLEGRAQSASMEEKAVTPAGHPQIA